MRQATKNDEKIENINLCIKDVKKNGIVTVNIIDVVHLTISHNFIVEYFTFSFII